MKPTVITVSVNYPDYLSQSLLHNRFLFDEYIVVTSPEDKRTQNISNYYVTKCITTNSFYKDGAKFNKWNGINDALDSIKNKDDKWILFLDSDIALPPISRRVFDEYDFDPECLYGIDRYDCVGIDNWLKYLANPGYVYNNWLMDMNKFDIGARICQYYGGRHEGGKFQGWLPLGFFQLAHGSQFGSYPSNSSTADHEDLVFAKQWRRNKRIMIPEIVGLHLVSNMEKGKNNWSGRVSADFYDQNKTIHIKDKNDEEIILYTV